MKRSRRDFDAGAPLTARRNLHVPSELTIRVLTLVMKTWTTYWREALRMQCIRICCRDVRRHVTVQIDHQEQQACVTAVNYGHHKQFYAHHKFMILKWNWSRIGVRVDLGLAGYSYSSPTANQVAPFAPKILLREHQNFY